MTLEQEMPPINSEENGFNPFAQMYLVTAPVPVPVLIPVFLPVSVGTGLRSFSQDSGLGQISTDEEDPYLTADEPDEDDEEESSSDKDEDLTCVKKRIEGTESDKQSNSFSEDDNQTFVKEQLPQSTIVPPISNPLDLDLREDEEAPYRSNGKEPINIKAEKEAPEFDISELYHAYKEVPAEQLEDLRNPSEVSMHTRRISGEDDVEDEIWTQVFEVAQGLQGAEGSAGESKTILNPEVVEHGHQTALGEHSEVCHKKQGRQNFETDNIHDEGQEDINTSDDEATSNSTIISDPNPTLHNTSKQHCIDRRNNDLTTTDTDAQASEKTNHTNAKVDTLWDQIMNPQLAASCDRNCLPCMQELKSQKDVKPSEGRTNRSDGHSTMDENLEGNIEAIFISLQNRELTDSRENIDASDDSAINFNSHNFQHMLQMPSSNMKNASPHKGVDKKHADSSSGTESSKEPAKSTPDELWDVLNTSRNVSTVDKKSLPSIPELNSSEDSSRRSPEISNDHRNTSTDTNFADLKAQDPLKPKSDDLLNLSNTAAVNNIIIERDMAAIFTNLSEVPSRDVDDDILKSSIRSKSTVDGENYSHEVSDDTLIKEVEVINASDLNNTYEDVVISAEAIDISLPGTTDITLVKERYRGLSDQPPDEDETTLKVVGNSGFSQYAQVPPGFNVDNARKSKGFITASEESEFSEGGIRLEYHNDFTQPETLSDLAMDCEGDAFITTATHLGNTSLSRTPLEWNNIANLNQIPQAQLLNAHKSKGTGTASEGDLSDIITHRRHNVNRSQGNGSQFGSVNSVNRKTNNAGRPSRESQLMGSQGNTEFQGSGDPQTRRNGYTHKGAKGNSRNRRDSEKMSSPKQHSRREFTGREVESSSEEESDEEVEEQNSRSLNNKKNAREKSDYKTKSQPTPVRDDSAGQSHNLLMNQFETDRERQTRPRVRAEPAPLNRNEILFVYHREAEVWTERNLVNRLLEMRASITTKLIHQLYSGGKTKEELAVESLKKCNHAVVVLSRKFAECELSFYLLGYIVNSFRKKLVTVQAEDCDPPSIIGHLGILKLDSPNFWRNLVAGIDEELDQATEDYKKPWLFRGQDPFLLLKSRPDNPVQPHLQQRITVPSTPDRRNDHRVVFLVNLGGKEGLRPYDHSHDCMECPTYRVKPGKIKVYRFLRGSEYSTQEPEVEKWVKWWEDKYRQPHSEEALKNEIAFWIRLQNPTSAHKIKAIVRFDLEMTEPHSHEPRTVHCLPVEFETKPLRPRKPKDSAVKRKPGNQGDEEFGDDDIHYHGSRPSRKNTSGSRNSNSGGVNGGASNHTHGNRSSNTDHPTDHYDVPSVQSSHMSGVQESGEDKSLTYDLNGVELSHQGFGGDDNNQPKESSGRLSSEHTGDIQTSEGAGHDLSDSIHQNNEDVIGPNVEDNTENGTQQTDRSREVEGHIMTRGVSGRGGASLTAPRPRNVMEELFGGFLSGGVKPKPSNPHYGSGQRGKKKVKKGNRKFHGYNTNKDDFIPPDTFDTPDAKSTRSVGIMKPPGPVRARPGPTVIVTKEEVEDIEEEEKQERLHGLQTVTYSADEWEDVPQPQKRMELGMPRTSRGNFFTKKTYQDLVFNLEQLGEKAKDPEMYRQFMEKADEYVKEFYVNKSKKRTDEQIVITLKKCGVEHYRNNLKMASAHVKTALDLLPNAKYQRQLEARTYYYISTIYREKKKFGKAKHWIRKAKNCLQDVEKGEDTAKTYYNEGRLYMRMLTSSVGNDNYREQAIECFKCAMDHAQYQFDQYGTRLDVKLVRRCLLNMARILVDLPETEVGIGRNIVTHENLLEAEDCISQLKNPKYYHNMSQRNCVQLHLAEAGLCYRRARMFCQMSKMDKAEALIGDAVLKTHTALQLAEEENFKEAKIAQTFMKSLTSDRIFVVLNGSTNWMLQGKKLESNTSSSDIATDGASGRERKKFYGPSDLSDSGAGSSAYSDVQP